MAFTTMKTTFLLMVIVSAITWSYSNAQALDPQGCLNTFKTSGCLKSFKGVLHWHLFGIKKECCKTISSVADLCWPLLFPSMPYIRFIVKGICTIKYSLH